MRRASSSILSSRSRTRCAAADGMPVRFAVRVIAAIPLTKCGSVRSPIVTTQSLRKPGTIAAERATGPTFGLPSGPRLRVNTRLPFTSGHHEMSRLNATRPVAASIRTMRLGCTNPASGA
jgi:hypothetical protein